MTTAVGPSSFEVSWPQSPSSWAWVRKLACHMRFSFCRSKILDLPLVFKKKTWKISDLSWHNTNVIKWFINLGTSEKRSSHRNDHRIRILHSFVKNPWELLLGPSSKIRSLYSQRKTLMPNKLSKDSRQNSLQPATLQGLRIAFLFHEVQKGSWRRDISITLGWCNLWDVMSVMGFKRCLGVDKLIRWNWDHGLSRS